MCKVSAISKVNDKMRDDAWVFMMMLGELMSSGNNDGLGYAAFDKSGNIFGEKWLNNKDAFKDLSLEVPNLNANKMDKIYSYFGDKVLKNEMQAMVLHTRAATCGRGIQNTHPFINREEKPSVAIIHNGVIGNHETLTKKFSTCDSEVIVHLYDEYNVHKDLNRISQVTSRLRGWYTVLALSKDENGTMFIDAFTDSNRLSSFYVKELDTRVYSTMPADILKVAEYLGMKCSEGRTMKPNTAQRINALTGEVMERAICKPMEFRVITEVPKKNAHGISEVHLMNGNWADEHFANAFWNQIKSGKINE